MKLVPLSDRVVLKQLEAEETTKSGIILNKCCTGKTTGRRSSSSRTGWSCRRKRSEDAGQRRTESYLF